MTVSAERRDHPTRLPSPLLEVSLELRSMWELMTVAVMDIDSKVAKHFSAGWLP